MFTPGLTNAPITKLFLIYTITSSITLSILDIKHLAAIYISPHIWTYGQFWRALVWQSAGFANSTEALFAAVLVYHLRVVERGWGTRKTASFIISTIPYTTLLPPILLALVIRPLSLNMINHLPSGPTTTIFALLAQYHAIIPHTYRYRLATSGSTPHSTTPSSNPTNETTTPDTTTTNTTPTKQSLTLLLSNKSSTYLIALQLALSQFPAMLLPAAAGWFVGLAWRAEFLPGLDWRVPAWVVGEKETRRRSAGAASGGVGDNGHEEGSSSERYEDLRRRLEGEVAAASSSGMEGQQGSSVEGQRQRNGILERLREVF